MLGHDESSFASILLPIISLFLDDSPQDPGKPSEPWKLSGPIYLTVTQVSSRDSFKGLQLLLRLLKGIHLQKNVQTRRYWNGIWIKKRGIKNHRVVMKLHLLTNSAATKYGSRITWLSCQTMCNIPSVTQCFVIRCFIIQRSITQHSDYLLYGYMVFIQFCLSEREQGSRRLGELQMITHLKRALMEIQVWLEVNASSSRNQLQ